jgi:poly(A) polymerase
MTAPVILPRDQHPISRRDIDPDALKVLYRLRQFNYVAYLVGGSVRDLLIGRKPKDFDIGTSAHPYEVKRLFRNCWVIGRRFRLAHVRFGTKAIEVATFRRQVSPAEMESVPAADGAAHARTDEHADRLVHRDNTFGTPEEDAFRRDFTINGLFYDIASFSVIDYVGGLDDLKAGVVRSIGDPHERFREDPVRMLRAIALAARLSFDMAPSIVEAIARHREEIARSAPPRLLEEFYKILRNGAAEATFQGLAEHRLLEVIAPELQARSGNALWQSLAALDRYRLIFPSVPDTLTNPLLLGSLIVPTGLMGPRLRRDSSEREGPNTALGRLTLARRDVERLTQILALERRMLDPNLPLRARRGLAHRNTFPEALTWLEIHGDAPDAVQEWKTFLSELPAAPVAADRPHRRFRRRRRGRRRRPGASGA